MLLRLRLRGRTLIGGIVEAVAEHVVSNPPDPSAFERGPGVVGGSASNPMRVVPVGANEPLLALW